MKKFEISFNGTDEQFLAGAIANNYKTEIKSAKTNPETGEVTQTTVSNPETPEAYVAKVLMRIPPEAFVRTAAFYYQEKKGSENYDAIAMIEAMKYLITITIIEK
jgi:hypothetical protein